MMAKASARAAPRWRNDPAQASIGEWNRSRISRTEQFSRRIRLHFPETPVKLACIARPLVQVANLAGFVRCRTDLPRRSAQNKNSRKRMNRFGIKQQIQSEVNMLSRLPFFERIKLLSLEFINGKDASLNRPDSHEVEILPAPQRAGQQRRSSVLAIRLGTGHAVSLASGKTNRLWLVNQESGRHVQHTHSNLG
jgi:hypothetical protein